MSLAEAEVAKRQAKIQEAQAQIVEANLLHEKGDEVEAMRLYLQAYESLPDAPLAAATKKAARDGFTISANVQAKKLADEAHYADARALLDKVLEPSFNPDDAATKRLLKQFDDPERYPPALTPEHKANVSKVEATLTEAAGFMDLGDFDKATDRYADVLRIDKYNSAARRGMGKADQRRAVYFTTARDHMRSKALTEVSKQWESPVPQIDVSGQFGGASEGGGINGGKDDLLTKLKTIIIPVVDLQGASLDEVVEFLRIRARDLDPAKKGIGIVLKASDDLRSKAITLNLTQAPLIEVLRYVTEMSGTAYRLDGYAVTIVGQAEKSNTMVTKSFRVPPTFIQNAPIADAAGGAGVPPADPFANKGGKGAGATQGLGTGTPLRRLGAKEFLESQGVIFPEGSMAGYNAATNVLFITNTVENIGLIETLIDQATSLAPRQVEIQVKMIEINQSRLEELGFDWLIGQSNVPGTKNVFTGGGTIGNQRNGNFTTADFPIGDPNGDPVGQNPLTSGLRGSADILNKATIETLIAQKNFNTSTATDTRSPGTFALAGVFTDPQFQGIVRALSQNKGVDLMAAPMVVTKSGQRATIVTARELRYPTEFTPPQIPQTLTSRTRTTIVNGVRTTSTGRLGAIPVTPTTPTAFEKRDVGITLEVEPVISENNRSIDMNLAPSSVEFEGFINYGIPFTSSAPGRGNSRTNFVIPNPILQPIFRTNKVTTSVTVWDGSTVVLGGVIREDRTDINDKVPMLGDLPLVGRSFQSKASRSEKKAIIFFVTPHIIDPAGVRLNRASTAER